MLRHRLLEPQTKEAAQGQGIGAPPRDPAFRIDALEVADQQQPEVGAGRQTRPPDRDGVERGALRLDERVEVVRVEDLVQSLIERMPAGARQVVRRDPQVRRACAVFASPQGRVAV